MSLTARVPALAPFQIRSFRFQWPADLLASWAFEMEGVILGWFVLVSTGSVLALAVFGSLQFLGTLISPVFGMVGDRIGNRNLLCLMRATYLAVATALAALFLAGLAAPVPVFALATVMGLVRPSDITLRNLLVGETMPASYLMRAMGVSRTTAELGARGRCADGRGPGRGARFGCGLCRGLCRLRGEPGAHAQCRTEAPARRGEAHVSPMRALRQGFAYVWSTPDMRALMLLAFLMNFAAYPLVGSLLAYIAKDIYGLDQTGLGWLIACFAGGALVGSIAISIHGARIRPARTMLAGAIAWFTLNLVFSWISDPLLGEVVLFVAGFVQSFCMIPMAVLLLRVADPAFSRPRHGRAHAGCLRHAARPFAVGTAGRARGIRAHRLALQRAGDRFHRADRAPLARPSLASGRGRQRPLGATPAYRLRCGRCTAGSPRPPSWQ